MVDDVRRCLDKEVWMGGGMRVGGRSGVAFERKEEERKGEERRGDERNGMEWNEGRRGVVDLRDGS